jgi:hypothetical protein
LGVVMSDDIDDAMRHEIAAQPGRVNENDDI